MSGEPWSPDPDLNPHIQHHKALEVIKELTIKQEKLTGLAVHVVNMFDQANTSNNIVNIGSRGKLLKKAVDDLRQNLNASNKKTILTFEQAK